MCLDNFISFNSYIPDTSKYFLYLDVPYRYAKRSFAYTFAYTDRMISISSGRFFGPNFQRDFRILHSRDLLAIRITHFAFGLLLIIPLIGHITAIAYRALHPNDVSNKNRTAHVTLLARPRPRAPRP